MAIIKVGLNVQVVGGPVASVAPVELEVEAYDKIEISLESGQPAKIVDVQPGTDSVNFLLIKSSEYTPPDAASDKQLTYKIDDKPAINLDQPQIYLGAGAISSLLSDVKKITFENKLENPEPIKAKLEILVGRDATPPPAA